MIASVNLFVASQNAWFRGIYLHGQPLTQLAFLYSLSEKSVASEGFLSFDVMNNGTPLPTREEARRP